MGLPCELRGRRHAARLALGNEVHHRCDVGVGPGVLTASLLTASLLTGSFDYALRVACADRADLAAVTEIIRDKAGAQET